MPSGTPESPHPGRTIRDSFDLSGKSFLVTGAGRGLGRAIALAVSAAGGQVVAVSRTAGELEITAGLAAAGTIQSLSWDVSESALAEDLILEASRLVGPLDGVVHAAGIQRRGPAEAVSVETWREVTGIHLEAPFFLSTALYRTHQAQGRGGAHLFIGSLASGLGLRGISPYAAGKSGVLGVVRTLAVEWARAGVRVNCLAPGYIQTALTADLLSDPERASWVHSRIPLGRLGTEEEIAGPAVFLLSDAAAYVTGQTLFVDGGWRAG